MILKSDFGELEGHLSTSHVETGRRKFENEEYSRMKKIFNNVNFAGTHLFTEVDKHNDFLKERISS